MSFDFEEYLESLPEYREIKRKIRTVDETVSNLTNILNNYPRAKLVPDRNNPERCVGKTYEGFIVLFSNPISREYEGKEVILLEYQERESRKTPGKQYIKCFKYVFVDELDRQIENFCEVVQVLLEKKRKIVTEKIKEIFLRFWKGEWSKFVFLAKNGLLTSLPDSVWSDFPIVFVMPHEVLFSVNPYAEPYYEFEISYSYINYWKYCTFELPYVEEYMSDRPKIYSNTLIVVEVFLGGQFEPEGIDTILRTFIPGFMQWSGYRPSMGYYPDLQLIAIDDRIWESYKGEKVLRLSDYADEMYRYYYERYREEMDGGFKVIEEKIGRFSVTLRAVGGGNEVEIHVRDRNTERECTVTYDLPRYSFCYLALFAVIDKILSLLGEKYEE